MTRAAIPVMLLLLPSVAIAAADVDLPDWPRRPPLEVIHSCDEHGGELLYKPWDLDFDDDGLTYVLCQGDSRVCVFGPGWEAVRSFGAPGEGPGEFGQAWALAVVGDEVRVFQPYRQTVFARDGTWLRIDRLDVLAMNAVAVGDEVWALEPGRARLGVRLAADGTVLGDFGPDNPYAGAAGREAAQHWNSAWRILPRGDSVQLLDGMQGIWYDGPEPGAAVLADLGAVLGRGWSRSDVMEQDGTVTINSRMWTPLLGGALDGAGGLWTMARSIGLVRVEPGEAPRLGAERMGIFAISPRDELVALDFQAGTLTVYALPR